MSDVFVSYKREDFARVERLVSALRADGLDVWWDQDIPTGAPWEAEITAALEKARCVVVCWSQASTHPQTGAKVQIEARVANDAGKLLQVRLEPAAQPLFFRQQQAADLGGWNGEPSAPAFRKLVEAAREVAGGSRFGATRFDAAAAPAMAAANKRAPHRAWIAAGAFLAILAGAGAFVALSPEARLAACTLRKPDALCLTPRELDAFDAALADAKARLAQRAIFYINDRRQNFPSLAWAISQLAAPNAAGLASYQAAYETRMADLMDPACGCLTYGPAPHTMTNAWRLVAAAGFGAAAPASVIDAVIAGQSEEGWWSSTLDAVDEPGNGSTYATAFVILSLQKQLDLGLEEAPRAAAMRQAAEAASRWLIHQVSTAEGHLADYPQSLRKLADPGIDGQTLAALAAARPDVDLGARARLIAGALGRLPPLWATTSSDVLVMRTTNAQYYDDFRHISAAWMVLGAASGLKDLGPFERARVLAAVKRVFARDLTSPALFEREWVAAEAIFALGETVERLRTMEEKGLDAPFAAGVPAADGERAP